MGAWSNAINLYVEPARRRPTLPRPRPSAAWPLVLFVDWPLQLPPEAQPAVVRLKFQNISRENVDVRVVVQNAGRTVHSNSLTVPAGRRVVDTAVFRPVQGGITLTVTVDNLPAETAQLPLQPLPAGEPALAVFADSPVLVAKNYRWRSRLLLFLSAKNYDSWEVDARVDGRVFRLRPRQRVRFRLSFSADGGRALSVPVYARREDGRESPARTYNILVKVL